VNYGLLSYRNTENLGDEIQSIAARRFLPRVDACIDRDLLTDVDVDGPVALILNGWFLRRPENWPPADQVVPLLISMHLADPATQGKLGISAPDVLLGESLVAYLREWGPVGARDLRTLARLEAAGVPAYFSGCLTLTLERDPEIERGDEIVLVDLPPRVVEIVRTITQRDIVCVTHAAPGLNDVAARFERAHDLLRRYQQAHMVITSRLHAALPCLAYETPVLLVRDELDPRLDGLGELTRSCSMREMLEHRVHLEIEDPRPNERDHLRFRSALTETVTQFVDGVERNPAGWERRDSSIGGRAREASLWSLVLRASAERDALAHRVDELQREVDALHETRSWRMTRLARRLRRLGGPRSPR